MIVGIDLGVRTIHVSTPSKCFTITAEKKSERHTEIINLYTQFYHRVIGPKMMAKCFVEEPVVAGARNLRSSLQIAQVSGAILATPINSYLVPVSTWKKEVVGKGNASKDEVAEWLLLNRPELYELTGGKQDHIDATCIRLYGEIVESRILTA